MKLYNLDSVLTFGKYKKETILEILKKDSSYIINHCLKEHDNFYITGEVFEASIIYGRTKKFYNHSCNSCDKTIGIKN